MQSSYLDIYKMASEKTGKSEQLYKDLGSFIFSETSKSLKNPQALIYKLKGVGSWWLRKTRMEIVVNEWPWRGEERDRSEFESDSSYKDYLDKYNQHNTFKERLKDYEVYLEKKRKIREKRNETQILLQPIDGEDIRFKSS